MAIQTYHGSCHCQAVKYEATFDLSAGTNRCNCSICSKSRAWFAFVGGDGLRVLSGEDALSDYQWVPPGREHAVLTYRFCSKCGVRLFGTGDIPQMGGRFYAVQVATLDDADREELVNAPLNYFDNAHDRPDRAPEDIRLL